MGGNNSSERVVMNLNVCTSSIHVCDLNDMCHTQKKDDWLKGGGGGGGGYEGVFIIHLYGWAFQPHNFVVY